MMGDDCYEGLDAESCVEKSKKLLATLLEWLHNGGAHSLAEFVGQFLNETKHREFTVRDAPVYSNTPSPMAFPSTFKTST